jgi:hypothetical protein
MKKLYLIGGVGFLGLLGWMIAPKLIPEAIPESVSAEIISNPPGASVWMNGANTKKITPTTLKGIRPNRSYQLQLKRRGYQTAEKIIRWTEEDYRGEIKRRGALEERFTLDRALGTLMVETRPPGAQVYLNDMLIGVTPLKLAEQSRAPGDHMLLVRHPKYQEPLTVVFSWDEELVKYFDLKMKGRRRR